MDEAFSIGNYVLTGGELPALVMIGAIALHVPDVLLSGDHKKIAPWRKEQSKTTKEK